jgi:1,2-diacylglycerol 3-alpha-glucosyltransferase
MKAPQLVRRLFHRGAGRSLRVGVVAACPWPVPQGSQVYITQTVRALQRQGHAAQLLCYAHGAREAPPDIPVLRCPALPGYRRTKAGPSLAKPLLDLLLAREIRRAARAHGWEAVVAHNYEGLAAALFSGIRPVVYMPHNAMADELPFYFQGAAWACRAGEWLDRILPRRADAIVAMHHRLRDYLVQCGCDPSLVTVRPPDLPEDIAPPPVAPPGEPFVLYTGNLDAYQNLPMLLEAMELVRREIAGARLVIATHQTGEVPGAEMVRITGTQDLQALLHHNCIVAIPRTSWSGYPIKLMNALAAGRPVVACESAAGMLRHGVDGWVVKDGDTPAMARVLADWLRAPSSPGFEQALETPDAEDVSLLTV